ncbi:MAG: hypothetical protein JSV52_03675 [Candidatus Zixiibacteriota bacterium]|nr:MAG: hypothetical protein JSV52_03675 [candidate division Zixibacteria bacterium]
MKIIRIILSIVVLSLFMTASAGGQIIFGQPASSQAHFVYSSWTLTENLFGVETTISQWYIPVHGFIPLRDNLEARIYLATSSSSGSVEGLDLENSVSGFSDARVQISQALSDDHILISGGVNLPTGKTELDMFDEYPLVLVLSQDFLDFPLRRLGEGFGFNLMIGGATAVGEARIGGGVMYRYTGEYTPYEGTFGGTTIVAGDYDPGDVITVNAGADLPTGNITWSANVIWTMYGDDKLDGVKNFKQSQQLDFGITGTYKSGPYTINGWTSYLLRGNNTEYRGVDLVPSESKYYGREFAAGATFTYKTASGWYFTPLAKLRMIGENELDFGSSDIMSFGATIGKTISQGLDADAGFRYYTGSAISDLIDITGYQLSVGLLAEF